MAWNYLKLPISGMNVALYKIQNKDILLNYAEICV